MIENETYYSSIFFGDYKEVQIENQLKFDGEPDHIGATPELSYQGWCEISGQASLLIKSDDFTTEWLRENITEDLAQACFSDDEYIYDWSYAEFEGNDK